MPGQVGVPPPPPLARTGPLPCRKKRAQPGAFRRRFFGNNPLFPIQNQQAFHFRRRGGTPYPPPSFSSEWGAPTPHLVPGRGDGGAKRNCCSDERTRRVKHPTRTIAGIYTSAPATIREEPNQHGQIHDEEAEVRAACKAAGSGLCGSSGPGQAPGRRTGIRERPVRASRPVARLP